MIFFITYDLFLSVVFLNSLHDLCIINHDFKRLDSRSCLSLSMKQELSDCWVFFRNLLFGFTGQFCSLFRMNMTGQNQEKQNQYLEARTTASNQIRMNKFMIQQILSQMIFRITQMKGQISESNPSMILYRSLKVTLP